MTSHGGEISVTEANPKIAEFVINHEIWEHWIEDAQWKFSSQKGMKIKVLTKAGLEPETAEFPQKVTLTTEPWS